MAADSSSLESGSGGVKRAAGCDRRKMCMVMITSLFIPFFVYSTVVINKTDYAQIKGLPFRVSHSTASHNTNGVSAAQQEKSPAEGVRKESSAQQGKSPAEGVRTESSAYQGKSPAESKESSAQQGKSPAEGERKESSTTSASSLHNVTIVTAFYDIGQFGKGSPAHKRDWHIYQKWSSAYSMVNAPVVMYTNSENLAKSFVSVRKHLSNLTKVVKVEEADIWAFSLKPQIARIYASGYPRHWPNTVNPGYTCVTHAKFDFLQDTMDKGYFPSRQVAWMDIGYLRSILDGNKARRYHVYPPDNFDPRRVLCGEVFNPNFKQNWRSILHRNQNWVAGGFFLATRDVMGKFVKQYRHTVTTFLHLRESQVEQQVIYASYTDEGRKIVHPTVELQVIHGGWFDSGFKCLHNVQPPPKATTTTTARTALALQNQTQTEHGEQQKPLQKTTATASTAKTAAKTNTITTKTPLATAVSNNATTAEQ